MFEIAGQSGCTRRYDPDASIILKKDFSGPGLSGSGSTLEVEIGRSSFYYIHPEFEDQASAIDAVRHG